MYLPKVFVEARRGERKIKGYIHPGHLNEGKLKELLKKYGVTLLRYVPVRQTTK